MFKNNVNFLALSLVVLSSCVTMGGGKRNRIEKGKEKPDESKPEKGGRSGLNSKLSTLSNLSKLAQKTKQENIAILNEILKSLNKSEKPGDKNQKGKGNSKDKPGQKEKGSNNQENIDFAERIIRSGTDLKVLRGKVDEFINLYDNITGAFFMDPSNNDRITQDAAVKKTYTNAVNHLKKMGKYRLKARTDVGGDYAKYLQEQLKISGLSVNKKPEAGKEDEYIKAVEDVYKAKYKQLLGDTSDDFNTLRTNYERKVEAAGDQLKGIEGNILTAYKEVDKSYKLGELPLAIEEIVKKYKGDRRKIIELLIENEEKLKGFKTLVDVSNPDYKIVTYYDNVTIEPMGDDYVIKMGNREFSAKDFVLDIGRNQTIKDTDDEKDKNGKKGKGGRNKDKDRPYFYKAERQISSNTSVFGKFMPKVEEELKKYGSDETEQSRRRIELKKLLGRFRDGKCTPAEKTIVGGLLSSTNGIGIKNWKEGSFDYWDQEDKDKLDLLRKMLDEKSKPDFDIKVTENKKDIVRLGGRLTGLIFSDFGMWEEQTLRTYSGNKILVNGSCDGKGKGTGKGKGSCKSLLPLSKQDSDFYTFVTGVDKFKKQFKKGGEGITKFEGKTIAGVTVTGDNGAKNSRTFDGVATLQINNDSGKGDFKLDYTGWYNFKFAGVDLNGKDSYEFLNHNVEVGGAGVKDFKFDFTNGNTFGGKIKGALYGLENDKPTETAGVFSISTNKVSPDTYNNMTIDGAFGMKIPEPKTERGKKHK